MTGKLKLWRNDGQTENGYPVKLILSHNNKRKRKKLFLTYEKDWNELKNIPRPTSPDYENKYDLVLSIKSKLNDVVFKNINDLNQAYNYLMQLTEKKQTLFITISEKG
jgi:hypothetical protein